MIMSKKYKSSIIVTTVPFGEQDAKPLRLLSAAGIECVINPIGRRLQPDEVADVIRGYSVVIAGTETISAETMQSCPDLKAICRVGIGLDSVDLLAARRLGIAVSYTPDGPSPAVAELTVGLIVDLLRGVGRADRSLRSGAWKRFAGKRIARSTIGIIGVGRIGAGVIRHLTGGFPGVKILANDLVPTDEFDAHPAVEWVDKERIYKEADIVSLHVPLSADTLNLISTSALSQMRSDAFVINTARGGIVDEVAFAKAVATEEIAGGAIDAFSKEPYHGPLIELDQVALTCHMGSMTADCRARMELEATEDAIRFIKGEAFATPVPEDEYANAKRFADGK